MSTPRSTGMFGYSIEEAQGRRANELLAGRYTDRADAGGVATLDRRRGRRRGGNPRLRQERRRDLALGHVKAFRNARGRIKYMFALLTDISESRQLRSLQQLIMTRAGR